MTLCAERPCAFGAREAQRNLLKKEDCVLFFEAKQRQQSGVILRLWSGWLSPRPASRCRSGGSPLRAVPRRCRRAVPDCHLVRTVIPTLPRCGQPRRFPPQSNRLLASFAAPVSRSDRPIPRPRGLGCVLRSVDATQGRLLRAQRSRRKGRVAPQRGFIARSVPRSLTIQGSTPGTRAGLHGNRVVTPMPLGDARSPQAPLLPTTKGIASLQHPPQTGRKQQAPKVSQLCPLKDF